MSNFKYFDRNVMGKFNIEKENLRDYFETDKPSIGTEKNRKSPYKTKYDITGKFNHLSKSSSIPKNIVNPDNTKNKDSLQDMGNNINISVNNLIINNPSPNRKSVTF